MQGLELHANPRFFCTILGSTSFIGIVIEGNETRGYWHKTFLKLYVFNSGN
jgi:hypothetical protein